MAKMSNREPSRVLTCTFPFPDQTPPVQVSHPCVQCPNADRAILDLHAKIKRNDPELLAALRSFAAWFFAPEAEARVVEQQIQYATDLYTRTDHSGTCIPKTILFAYYKWLQLSSGYGPELSDSARDALKGVAVASWPDGAVRRGRTWGASFEDYSARYE